jgi:nitrilase
MSDKNRQVKIAVAQASSVFMDRSASTEKACGIIAEAGKNGVELVVFPEAFIPGYPDWVWVTPPGTKKPLINEMFSRLLANSVSIPDETTAALCKAAKDASITVAIGVNERNSESSGASLFNTLLYIGADGTILGKHRKLIPTGPERLMWSQGDGSTLVSFETSFGKLGGLLCWENMMPLARNAMYVAGVQVYLAPTWDSSETWLTAMRHFAWEGGMFVVNCCQAISIDDIPDSYEFKLLYPAGKEWINKGNSCVIDPRGKYVVEPLSGKEEIIYATLDLSLIAPQKWLFDVAGHYARPDVFQYGINGADASED